MEDLLSFLTGNIRKQGITVNEFCAQAGLSRQKFYRFVKEPERFTAGDIKRIREILRLGNEDSARLDHWFAPGNQAPPPLDPSDYTPFISDILRRSPSKELTVNRNNIEYRDASGSAAILSLEAVARLLAGFVPEQENEEAVISQKHEYAVSIYNCTLRAESGSFEDYTPSKSLITISHLLVLTERCLRSSSDVRVRVRHYLSARSSALMANHNMQDSDAVRFNLRLLSDVIPLLSAMEDYRIDTSGITRRFWTDHSDLCLIEHRCSEKDSDNNPCTEYFALVFSDSGECSVCRIGREEASNIFAFLSIDIQDKNSMPPGKADMKNPNLAFYRVDKNSKSILIHPDLCFADIPREMWMALYDIVKDRPDNTYYEGVFRALMDPYGEYAFLDFDSLVRLMVDVLVQRAAAGSEKGKIMICHPIGLQNFARTGVITDLIDEDADHAGQDLSHPPFRFPAPMVADLLRMVRDHIIRRLDSPDPDPAKPGETNYFILKPQVLYPEISYVIHKGFGVFPLNNKSRHKNTIINAFQNPAVGTLMYDYVLNKVIGRQNSELNTFVLSDEHSIAFLDKLIAEAEK